MSEPITHGFAHSRPQSRRTGLGMVPLGVAMVLAGAISLWVSWRYFVHTAQGQQLDDAALRASAIGRNKLWRGAEPVLDLIDEAFVVVVVGAAVTIAAIRRRWLLAIIVAVLVGGANVTTQVLKHLVIDRPVLVDNMDKLDNSLPSGHTTVAASTAAALVFVVPRSVKPAAALLGAAYAALTGVSTMIGGWHRPSDVVAAVAVVLLWSGVAVLFGAEYSRQPESPPSRAPAAVVTALLVLIAAIAGMMAAGALARTRELLGNGVIIGDRADLLAAYIGAAFGVVAITAVLFAATLAAGTLTKGPTG